jgi:hypothetical protein
MRVSVPIGRWMLYRLRLSRRVVLLCGAAIRLKLFLFIFTGIIAENFWFVKALFIFLTIH